MVRAVVNAVQDLVKEPVLVRLETGVTNRRTNYHAFVVGKSGLTEGVLAIALLKDAFFFDSLGDKKAESRVAKDRSIILILIVVHILKVAEDGNA